MTRRGRNPYGYFEFDNEAFEKWERENHIPEDVMAIVQAVAERIGIGKLEEETIELRNRGGHVYGYTKGFSLTHCTSSLADGPTPDYTGTFLKWVDGLGFYIAGSYGDNGMDSESNWHDTYWTKLIGYDHIKEYVETFEHFVPANKDDDDAYEKYCEYEFHNDGYDL